VTATAAGYEGGSLERPSYKDVCTDLTGHAEVVEVEFDPEKVSFEQLLDASLPCTILLPSTARPGLGHAVPLGHLLPLAEQEAQARAKIEQLTAEDRFKPKRIVTKVEPAQNFWRAESTTSATWKSAPGKLPHLADS